MIYLLFTSLHHIEKLLECFSMVLHWISSFSMGVLALVSKHIRAFLHGDALNKLGLNGCFSSGCL